MKKFTYEIERDEYPSNPRTEWDNITTMICFHKRYNLGDKHDFNSRDYESWEEMEEAVRNHYEVLALKPLYLYDHSGITISTSPFSCNFDSGKIGFVIVDKDNLQKLISELATHQQKTQDLKHDDHTEGNEGEITKKETELTTIQQQKSTQQKGLDLINEELKEKQNE